MFTKDEKAQPKSPISITFSRWPALSRRPLTEEIQTSWVAALLHHAVEDQEVPPDLIAREFGSKVADIVAEVTGR
jgi:hypothetical protein